jgi:ATP-dependent DNA ligase
MTEELTINENPQTDIWYFNPLYKHDVSGTIRYWQIGFIIDYDKKGGVIDINYGVVEGVNINNQTRVVLNNSKRTLKEQALLETRSRYKEKFREGYRPAGQVDEEMSSKIKPMLANVWLPSQKKDKMVRENQKIQPTMKPAKFPCLCQPKIDGIRCLSSIGSGSKVRLRSRDNKEFSFLDELREEMLSLFVYLPSNCSIDGELYVHGVGFNTVQSMVMGSVNRHPDNDKIGYCMFDLIVSDNPDMIYKDRMTILIKALQRYLETLEDPDESRFSIVMGTVVLNEEQALICFESYMMEGYEGIMLRAIDKPYVHNRTASLLKYKSFQDEEVEVIGIKEASGTEAGTALFIVRDIRDNEFVIRMRGTMIERRYWFNHPNEVIGKQVTMRYQELTEDGLPRFPVGISFREII